MIFMMTSHRPVDSIIKIQRMIAIHLTVTLLTGTEAVVLIDTLITILHHRHADEPMLMVIRKILAQTVGSDIFQLFTSDIFVNMTVVCLLSE